MSPHRLFQGAARFGNRALRKVFTVAGQKLMGTISHVQTQQSVMALTFDDGPHPVFTPRLLKILEKHGAHGTFFMLGKAAERHPRLVKQVAESGHTIGNHSYDHPSFPLITSRERRIQLRNCANATAPYGHRFFRPPFGDQNVLSFIDASVLGYKVVTWNVVAQDWLDHSAEWMAERLIKNARAGSIILLHDALALSLSESYCSRDTMLETLNIFLAQLSSNFRFVTVNELLRYGPPVRKVWKQEPNPQFLSQLKLPIKSYF